MKFVTFSSGGPWRIGLVEGDQCVDLGLAEEAYRRSHPDSRWQVPPDLKTFIAAGEDNLQAAGRLRDFAKTEAQDAADFFLPLDQITLHTPLPSPYMLAEMERNYIAQPDFREGPQPTYPAMTILPDTVINDPGAPVILPRWSRRVTVNAQIAFVCGQRVEGVTEKEAEDAIFGYTLLISFAEYGLVEMLQRPTERDRSINEDYGRWLDGFKPIGPWVVTPDEAGPLVPRSIHLTAGPRQSSVTSTSSMLYTPAEILAALSFAMPFYPGDVIGLGAMGPGLELSSVEQASQGTRVITEVESLGRLECIVLPADGSLDGKEGVCQPNNTLLPH